MASGNLILLSTSNACLKKSISISLTLFTNPSILRRKICVTKKKKKQQDSRGNSGEWETFPGPHTSEQVQGPEATEEPFPEPGRAQGGGPSPSAGLAPVWLLQLGWWDSTGHCSFCRWAVAGLHSGRHSQQMQGFRDFQISTNIF